MRLCEYALLHIDFLEQRDGVLVLVQVVKQLRVLSRVFPDDAGHQFEKPLRPHHDQAFVHLREPFHCAQSIEDPQEVPNGLATAVQSDTLCSSLEVFKRANTANTAAAAMGS